MKVLFLISVLLLCDFTKKIGLTILICLSGTILFDLFRFAFGYKTEFHFDMAFYLIFGLSLIVFFAHKIPIWLDNFWEKRELEKRLRDLNRWR